MKTAFLLSALLFAGCSSSICDKLEDAAFTCGQSFNRSECEKREPACSSNDLSILENVARCEQQPNVCQDGATVNAPAYGGCWLSGAGVSAACLLGTPPDGGS